MTTAWTPLEKLLSPKILRPRMGWILPRSIWRSSLTACARGSNAERTPRSGIAPPRPELAKLNRTFKSGARGGLTQFPVGVLAVVGRARQRAGVTGGHRFGGFGGRRARGNSNGESAGAGAVIGPTVSGRARAGPVTWALVAVAGAAAHG